MHMDSLGVSCQRGIFCSQKKTGETRNSKQAAFETAYFNFFLGADISRSSDVVNRGSDIMARLAISLLQLI
jgi:hypothetical protein